MKELEQLFIKFKKELHHHMLIASRWYEHLHEKPVYVNCEHNVPLGPKEGGGSVVLDGFRIEKSIPFLENLMQYHTWLLLGSHIGRPSEDNFEQFSIEPVAEYLRNRLNREVEVIDYDPAKKEFDPNKLKKEFIIKTGKQGGICILENLRYHPDQKANGKELANAIANAVYVTFQNSYGTAHRVEATNSKIMELIPAFAGDLMLDEIIGHENIRQPYHPSVAFIGGDKPTDSIEHIREMAHGKNISHVSDIEDLDESLNLTGLSDKPKIDTFCIGGDVMIPFVLALYEQGHKLTQELRDKKFKGSGFELLDDKSIELMESKKEVQLDFYGKRPKEYDIDHALGLMRLYNLCQLFDNEGKYDDQRRLVIPKDFRVIRGDGPPINCDFFDLQTGDKIVDIGEATETLFAKHAKPAKKIVWNGPMGLDVEYFDQGTNALIYAIHKNREAIKAVGGGSTMQSIKRAESLYGVTYDLDHRSTGGGATLREQYDLLPTIANLFINQRDLIRGRFGEQYEPLRLFVKERNQQKLMELLLRADIIKLPPVEIQKGGYSV